MYGHRQRAIAPDRKPHGSVARIPADVVFRAGAVYAANPNA